MTLLNASLAVGGVMIALPIVLHLIMRQRPKYMLFPAVRFIQKRNEANRRKLQLRHWLLLALRCAAILMLAFALARPSIKGSGVLGKEGAPIAAALVFDTHPRMEYRNENQTRLEAAQQLADWLISQLPVETAISVVDGATPQRMFAVDHGAAADQVRRLASSAASRPLHETIVDSIHLIRSKKGYRHEVYVFTDLSESAWTPSARRAIADALAGDDEIAIYVVDVGVEDHHNFGVSKLELGHDVVAHGAQVTLDVELASAGNWTEKYVELLLQDEEGRLHKQDQRLVESAEDATLPSTEFQLAGLSEGTHQGIVRVVGDDALAADDVRYFTVDVRPPPAILLLAEKESDAMYLRQAIAPSELVATGRARFRCDFFRFDQVSDDVFASYAAVCLLDPPSLGERRWKALSQLVEQGGSVAVFLGHHAALATDEFNSAAAQQLLPAPLIRAWNSDPNTYLSPDSYDHPVLARFRRFVDRGIPWNFLPVFKYWQMRSDQLHQGALVIASYADGRPALLERVVGKGRTITMTTPVSDPPARRNPEPWNFLPVSDTASWPFYLLAQGLADYLVGGGQDDLNYNAGQIATLRLTQPERQEVFDKKGYVVRTPDGELVRMRLRSGENTVIFSATQQLGNYRVLAGGRQGALKRGFSVNAPSDIGNLKRAARDEIALALGEEQVRFANSNDEIEVSVGLGRIGRELFPWLIAMLAVILASEYLMANLFYRH